jgi:hypothetical protein
MTIATAVRPTTTGLKFDYFRSEFSKPTGRFQGDANVLSGERLSDAWPAIPATLIFNSERRIAIDCINLRKRFGKRYRVRHEESWHAEGRRNASPELMILPCKYGHFYPWGGRMLAASVDGYPRIAAGLRRLGCVEVVQDGDFGELTAIFDVDDFGRVAKIMRPRRRRQVTPEQRVVMAARLRQSRQMTPVAPIQVQYSSRAGVSAPGPV